MKTEPLAYHLRQVPWQFYCTLTFGTGWSPKPTGRKLKACFEFLRKVYGFHGLDINQVRWILCPEDGEMGGRHHYHALLCDLPRATRGDTFALEHIWKQIAGGAKIRLYSPDLDGVGYVMKTTEQYLLSGLSSNREEANAFEVNKIGRVYEAIPSHYLCAWLRGNSSARGRRLARVKRGRDKARH